MRTCTCPCSSRSPASEGEGPCGGLRPRVRLGHLWAATEELEERYASGPPPRPCSASTIRISSSPTGGPAVSSTTSGAPCPAVGEDLRPFLRHREFLWQEGHTIHATPRRPFRRPSRCWTFYADFCENVPGHARGQGPEDRQGEVLRRRGDLYRGVHDARPEGPPGRAPATTLGTASPRPLTSLSPTRTTSRPPPHQTSWGLSTRSSAASS